MGLKSKGFTFLELMVGVAILSVVIIGLLLTFLSLMLVNESNNNLIIAANDAQYVLEQIKALPSYDSIAGYSPPTLNNIPGETITLNRVVESSNKQKITVNVNWQDKQRQRSFSLATRFARW